MKNSLSSRRRFVLFCLNPFPFIQPWLKNRFHPYQDNATLKYTFTDAFKTHKTKMIDVKSGLAVHVKWQPSSRCIPVIMQMMRDAWPLCHALLRKKKGERNSPEWRLLRTQAVGELTLAERRGREREGERQRSEVRWVQTANFTACPKRRNNSFSLPHVASTPAGRFADARGFETCVSNVGLMQRIDRKSKKRECALPIF